jgi:hypothetical protein
LDLPASQSKETDALVVAVSVTVVVVFVRDVVGGMGSVVVIVDLLSAQPNDIC